MRNIIIPDVLKTMIPQEFEDWREAGEDLRRELTHAVMRDLTCPADWDMNGEYLSEFGGFFPVQVRFTPSHGNFHIAVCSPGDVSPEWLVIFMTAGVVPFPSSAPWHHSVPYRLIIRCSWSPAWMMTGIRLPILSAFWQRRTANDK